MSTIFPSANPTLEERLRAVRHRLILIQAAVTADDDQLTVAPDQMLEAAYTATIEALALLEPVREHLPGDMANWHAPEGGAQ
jgi:hypothetical protein